MKIALVVHDFIKGVGHGRYCIELARRFSRDHEVHVLANQFDDKLDFPFQKRFVPAWRPTALASVLTFPAGVEKILRADSFDIVHAQGFACRRADVITAHVCNAARYKRAPARGILKRFFPALVIPREERFFREAHSGSVIAVSKILEMELREHYNVDQATVIYHGVDCDEFCPSPKRKSGGTWTWLFAGEASKGLRETLVALKEIPEARLDIVTRSKPAEWLLLARDLGVLNRIIFKGPRDDMVRCYQGADIFVYPSAYDTFGMVVAEAMACALPVVVSREIGAAEWIQDDQNGYLCVPGRLSERMKEIRDLSEGARAKVGQRARECARAHSWDHCAAETLAVYERVISSKRQSR